MVSIVKASHDSCVEAWEIVHPDTQLLLDNLVRRYQPDSVRARSSLTGGAPCTRWLDVEEVPDYPDGVVVAAQLARPPQGFGTVHLNARCCLRTPRPHLRQGGEWRVTFVSVVSEASELQWWRSKGLVNWPKNPHGTIPFRAGVVRWIFTIFVDKVKEAQAEPAETVGPGPLPSDRGQPDSGGSKPVPDSLAAILGQDRFWAEWHSEVSQRAEAARKVVECEGMILLGIARMSHCPFLRVGRLRIRITFWLSPSWRSPGLGT